MKLKVDYLIGKQIENEWSGVYGYKPDGVEGVELFSVMRLQTQGGGSLDTIAKMLLDELQTSFFDETNKENDLVIRLETSAWKMKSKMDLILSREPEIAEKGIDIELAVAVVFESFLYLAVIGESKVFIQRDGKLIELSKGLVDTNMSGFVRTGSLEMESDDIICLATSKAVLRGDEIIKDVVENLNIDNLENLKDSSGVSVLLIADEALEWKKGAIVTAEPISPDEAQTHASDNVVSEGVVDKEEVLEEDEEQIGNLPEINIHNPQSISEYELYDEEPEEKALVTSNLSEKFSAFKVLAIEKISKLAKKAQELRNRNKVDEEYEDDGERFSRIVREEDDMDEEYVEEGSELKDKVISTAKKLGSQAKTKWQNNLKPMIASNQKTYMKVLKDLAYKLGIWLGKLKELVKRELIGTGDRRDIYLRGQRRSRNRKIFAILLVVLVIVLYIGLRNAEENRRQQETINAARAEVTDLENRFQSLSSQVPQTKTDTGDRKTLLIEEFGKLRSDVENQKSDGFFKDELDQILANIALKEDELLFVEAFTQPSVITDIGKTYPDANLTDLVYSNGFVFVSDSSRGVVYRVGTATLDSVPEQFVTGLTQPYILAKDPAGDIVFYDNDTNSSLGKFGYNDPSVTRFSQLSPANIGKPTEAVIFDGNGALYELKAINRQIFKRDKSGDTFVEGGAAASTDPNTNWRTDSDYTNGVDIAAPYEIYVLIKGQGIKRYFSRNENTITFDTYNNLMQRDFTALQQASSFDVGVKYMAVGDPVNKRVMLFQIEEDAEKKLTFIKQFVYRGNENIFNDIDEIAINEAEKAIYVLDATRVIKLQF